MKPEQCDNRQKLLKIPQQLFPLLLNWNNMNSMYFYYKCSKIKKSESFCNTFMTTGPKKSINSLGRNLFLFTVIGFRLFIIFTINENLMNI